MNEYSKVKNLHSPIEVENHDSKRNGGILCVPWLGLYFEGDCSDRIIRASLEESKYGGFPGKLKVEGDILGETNIQRVLPLITWENFKEFSSSEIKDDYFTEEQKKVLKSRLSGRPIHAAKSGDTLILFEDTMTGWESRYALSVIDCQTFGKDYKVKCRYGKTFTLNFNSLIEL